MLASKTSAGDASTNSSLYKNNDSCVWFRLGGIKKTVVIFATASSRAPWHSEIPIQLNCCPHSCRSLLAFVFVVERGMSRGREWVTVADALPPSASPCAVLTYSPAYRSVSHSHLHMRRGVCVCVCSPHTHLAHESQLGVQWIAHLLLAHYCLCHSSFSYIVFYLMLF